jgi:HlyD family secretion protein
VVGYYVVKPLFKSPTDAYVLEKVSRGDVLQEVSETGSVKATDNISLGFKTVGRIQNINVYVGNEVKKGQVLASIDASQLSSQLENYKAALDVAKAQYQKLLNGYTPEDIKIYQDTRDAAQHDFNNEYISAINTLDDAYTKIYNSFNVVNNIQISYFSLIDQQGIKVNDSKIKINESMVNAKNYLDIARASSDKENIDNAISQTINFLNNVSSALKIVRDMTDESVYYTEVSSTDKASLDTQKTNINTALTSVTDLQQGIVAYKIALQKAENNLVLRQAEPRPEDIDVYKAQIEQAQANVNLYQSQLNDTSLRSPIDGRITKVNSKTGEVVSTNESVINLLSSNPFQIKVDIYEQDIVNVKEGNTVKITLVAFPKQTFEGRVVSIDPAEKIVDNVVYYEITVDFPNQPEGIKSGMTADIVVETAKKENVLRVPKNAVENIDGKEIIQVANWGKIEDRQITTGLEGNDYYEIVSGLREGDQIITGKK